jgi:hypothetical protein
MTRERIADEINLRMPKPPSSIEIQTLVSIQPGKRTCVGSSGAPSRNRTGDQGVRVSDKVFAEHSGRTIRQERLFFKNSALYLHFRTVFLKKPVSVRITND